MHPNKHIKHKSLISDETNRTNRVTRTTMTDTNSFYPTRSFLLVLLLREKEESKPSRENMKNLGHTFGKTFYYGSFKLHVDKTEIRDF